MFSMFKKHLTLSIILGMVLGLSTGILINQFFIEIDWVKSWIVEGVFLLGGKLFINALKMMVVPLVTFSLLSGVCGMREVSKLGSIGVATFSLYLATTAIAIATAIIFANLFNVGVGSGTAVAEFAAKETPGFIDVMLGILPNNVLGGFVGGNMLFVIIFTIFMGVCILSLGKEAMPLVNAAELLNKVMMKMVTIIMLFAPIAVFCLLARVAANSGWASIEQMLDYAWVLTAALLFHLGVTLMLILKALTGLSPLTFLKKIKEVQLFAFSTSSSNATIPVTLRTAVEKLGADKSIASFTVPFGATINMDGTAIMQGVATVFIANAYMVDLTIVDYVTVIGMAVLASVGTAGVPGVGLIMLGMVLGQVGLPVEGIALIIGIDRLMDMIRTVINVSGDSIVTCIIAKQNNMLNEEVYNR